MSPPDFVNICRLCLVKDKASIPIFEGEGAVRQIFTKIVTCLPVKVEKSDPLPKKICDVCLYNVENVFKFWHTTASSEKKLLQWLEGTDKIDDIPVGNGATIETEQIILKEETIEQEHTLEQVKQQVNEGFAEDIERSDDGISDEEGFNSEENVVNDTDGDKNSGVDGDSEEEEGYGELQPTTFVNVSLACDDQPGPSGLQTGQSLEQQLEIVQPLVTQTEPSNETNQEESVHSGQPDAVPSTSKTNPASSGSVCRRQEYGSQLTQAEEEERKRLTTCEFCGHHFPIPSLAEHHRRIHTGEKQFLCHVCGKQLRTMRQLRRHSLQHITFLKPFKCNLCESSFRYNFQLTVHKKFHSETGEFMCDVCNRTFHCKANLQVHCRRHFKIYKVYCKECNKGFYNDKALEDHMLRHTLGNKPFKCELCDMAYASRGYLSIHIRHFHEGQLKKFECDFCHKMLSRNALKNHIKSHTGDNKHVCDVCGKVLRSTNGLKNHKIIHTGEKPAKCKVCGKAFSSFTYLSTHMRCHTGERPYTCKECGKSFTQRSTLTIHIRSHTGEKPYSCTICSRKFVTKTIMKMHRKSHS